MHGDVSSVGSLEETQLFISSKIEALKDGKVSDQYDIQDILRQLSGEVKKIGLEEEGLNTLFDLVFSLEKPSYLRNGEKKFIITELFIPNQHYKISREIIYRIISNIGVERGNSGRNRRVKRPMLATGLQLCLLEWLLTSLHLFGDDVYQVLNRMLPILFSYLSYEYSRPYIANLISLGVINGKKIYRTYFGEESVHVLNTFKPWHVQLVVDLYYKFPMDDYLKGLLILFKSQDPTLNLNHFSKSLIDDLNDLGTINSKLFAYPGDKQLKVFNEIRTKYSTEDTLVDSHVLENNLIKYESFSTLLHKRKRRKGSNKEHIINIVGINRDKSAVSINNIGTIENLIEELNGIQVFDSTSILKPDSNSAIASNKLKRLFLTIQGLCGNEKFLKRLDYYIKLTLQDDGSSIKDLNILIGKLAQFSEFCSILEYLTSLKDFLFGDVYQLKRDDKYLINPLELMNLKLKILPNISASVFIQNYNELLESSFKVFSKETNNAGYLHCFISFLSTMAETLRFVFKQATLNVVIKFEAYEAIKNSVPKILNFVAYNCLHQSLELQLAVLELLKFVEDIEINHINEYFDARFIILEPPLVYSLVFSNNPMVFSELCGYFAFCKNYSFKEDEEKYKLLHNSYIMDVLNFIWRDMALSHNSEDNLNQRAMLLTPTFIDQLELLPVFNYSNFFKLPTVGNIFQNPAWSYITARIIWSLEDKSGSVTSRHEGPVCEESVRMLKQNPDVEWLNLNYSQLKVAVLKELESLGYTGLCDLLFNSLTSLLNERYT